MKNKIEEGTVAGDVGSATTGGTAPMKKIGAEAPLRRKNPLKKQGKKLKSFREIIKEKYISESPVGQVGVHEPVRRKLPNKKQGEKKMKSFREFIQENTNKGKYFLLTWYLNYDRDGSLNVYSEDYSKDEIYDLHKDDYNGNHILEVEEVTKKEAMSYDDEDWIIQGKNIKETSKSYIYYDIKKGKIIG